MLKRFLQVILVLTTGALPVMAQANSPSFNCANAGTPVEHSICDNAELAVLDAQLAKVYKQARASAADGNQVREDQRAWVKARNRCGANVQCLRESYQVRITKLGAKPELMPEPVAPVVVQAPAPKPVSKQSTQTSADSVSKPVSSLSKLLAEKLGANGWGLCSSSQIALSAIDARDNSLPKNVADANRNLGRILGDLRQELISQGYLPEQLDGLFTVSSRQIRGGDQALKNVVQCMETVAGVLKDRDRMQAGNAKNAAPANAKSAQADVMSLSPELAPLDLLFDPQKRWVSAKEVDQSGASCAILLDRNKTTLQSNQYTPTSVIGRMRLGGNHPNQNLPKQVMPDTNVMAAYSIVSKEPVVSFIMVTQARNSLAVFTSRWELDINKGSLTRVTRESCEGCTKQQQQFVKMQSERYVRYWCEN